MLKRLLSSAAGCIFIAGAAQAATIDFESFAEGEIVTASALPGVSALTVDTPAGNDFLIVYDSSPPVGADTDLEQPFTNAESEATLGGADAGMFSFLDDAVLAEFNPDKIGIFANDGSDCSSGTSCTPPDDAPNGGMVTFELDRIMFFNSIDLFDIESGGAEITLTLSDMVTEVVFTVGGFDTNGPPNKGVRVLADAAIAISKIKINFMGISGAFENINLSEIPVPGALPLLLSGIAGLGFASRRRKKA